MYVLYLRSRLRCWVAFFLQTSFLIIKNPGKRRFCQTPFSGRHYAKYPFSEKLSFVVSFLKEAYNLHFKTASLV